MSRKKSTIVLNVEHFIRDIESRPAIWNRNFHCNKAFLEQMWDELSNEHKLPKVILKAKWKGLRDNFRVEYKRIPRSESGDFLVEPAQFESKWIHYYALLFLTEHMRHRLPKTENDLPYYFSQSDDGEKTVVEPDLTNGLIRRIPDSDEDFDEDDEDDDEDLVTTTAMTPPVAHTQCLLSTVKSEDTRALLIATTTTTNGLSKAKSLGGGVEREAQDLSKKSTTTSDTAPRSTSSPNVTATTVAAAAALLFSNAFNNAKNAAVAATDEVSATNTTTAVTTSASVFVSSNTVTPITTTVSTTTSMATQHNKKRSVSPPPLYNKAHHPLPALPATALTTAAALNKERNEYVMNGSCLHPSSHDYSKQPYAANGVIPALRLKRPRLTEENNCNGSSAVDAAAAPPVPEDDDYHYLLSLHPYMKQLTAAQKLRIRTKIQKLIFKELYKEDLEEAK